MRSLCFIATDIKSYIHINLWLLIVQRTERRDQAGMICYITHGTCREVDTIGDANNEGKFSLKNDNF